MIAQATICALLVCLGTHPAAAQEWKYDAMLYGWFSGISGTIGKGVVVDEPVSATFSDLAKFLDFAAAGHFEATNSNFLVEADANYVGLGSTRDAEIGNQTVEIDMDYKQWILELGGGYRISPEVDLLIVGRYYIQDVGETKIGPVSTSGSGTTYNWGDVFVGARYTTLLANRWVVSGRGDVGFGGSQFAWFFNAFAGYQFSPLFTAGIDYRLLSLDYETGEGVDFYKYDVTTDGIGVALIFGF